jgi:methionyl aminopeptidase
MNILERIFNSKKDDKKDELGRNDTCWCGSGKKYKRCHLDKDAYKRRMQGSKPKGK